ncbi:MAG TPA: guanylate kinase [Candidatus Eisenbacteria bacterium]|nr:guanylate kinase [Candidatus Eisenbacteria bacterium]
MIGSDYRRFVVVISGPSGAGKSSFVKALLRGNGGDLVYSVSATTRPKRAHEVEGKDYFFLTRDEFQRRVDSGDFVEHAQVHGEMYGTLRSQIERVLESGRNVLLDVDVQGGQSVRRVYRDAVLIFVLPPSLEDLEDRLRARGTDREDKIQVRLENAQREIALMREYDYAVVNDDLETAARKVLAIVEAERCRASRRIDA